MEIHRKRHRGPEMLWPLTRALTNVTRHLPHWATPFHEAIDRAAFETTIAGGQPPPPTGVREPQRPTPAAPSASQRQPRFDSQTHDLGYERVDDDPHVAVLTATMDATARWDATIELRTWEREHLRLRAGQRLLDVGCGLGEAALALGDDLGEDGEVVGVDSSVEMLRIARLRANRATCRVRWVIGDALALDEPDDSFDVVRCERTLQWLADPSVAVAEMARVVRPGGRISLIDTDWSTFRVDIGDDDIDSRVSEALRDERNRSSNVGRRLSTLIHDSGLNLLAETTVTQIWTDWDPDESPAPAGCFSMRSLADDLVDTGQLDPGETEWFVSMIHDAARRDRFSMSLAMFAVVAESGKIAA